MVDPNSTNKTIDTGQNCDGNSFSRYYNTGQQQQRMNLVENFQRNSNNGQDVSQSELAGNENVNMIRESTCFNNGGQLQKLNALNNTNNDISKLEWLEPGQKRNKNPSIENHMEADEMNDEIPGEDNIVRQEESMFNENQSDQNNIKGLSFEMEFEIDEIHDHYVSTSTKFVGELLQKWLKSNAIEGVKAVDNTFIRKELLTYQSWAIPPKIIHRKQSITAEMIVEVETNESAYSLYLKEKDYCNKYNIRVSSKNTIMEYTTKIGFLTGPYVKIAAPKYYITDLKRKLDITNNLIDVKKEYTYDKGKRSKVLAVYAIEKEAENIDAQLKRLKSKRYRYLSYKFHSSDERMGAMHYNDVINVKARYETLIDASLNEKIKNESSMQETLESILMKVQNGNDNLFLAVEQGVGKYENNITVIINPKTIRKTKQWIVNEYPKLDFEDKHDRRSSINEQEYKMNKECDEELCEFLRPVLESKEAKKNKVFGKNMKSYAQALGIQQYNEEAKQVEKKTKDKKTTKINKITNENKYLNEVIETLQLQVKKLTEVIMKMSEIVVIDEEKKNNILNEVNQISEVQVIQMTHDSEQEKTNASTKKVNNQLTDKEKRKVRSITPMYQNNDNEESGNFDSYNQWYKEEGIQVIKRPRNTYQNKNEY